MNSFQGVGRTCGYRAAAWVGGTGEWSRRPERGWEETYACERRVERWEEMRRGGKGEGELLRREWSSGVI